MQGRESVYTAELKHIKNIELTESEVTAGVKISSGWI